MSKFHFPYQLLESEHVTLLECIDERRGSDGKHIWDDGWVD